MNVRPSTRMCGDAGNRYPVYVFGRRVRTPNDEGWLPADILAFDSWLRRDADGLGLGLGLGLGFFPR